MSALDKARRAYPRSRGFQGAFSRGAAAARRGRPVTECPYVGKAWRLAWIRGHESEAAG